TDHLRKEGDMSFAAFATGQRIAEVADILFVFVVATAFEVPRGLTPAHSEESEPGVRHGLPDGGDLNGRDAHRFAHMGCEVSLFGAHAADATDVLERVLLRVDALLLSL